MGRIHRYGQKDDVWVYNLVATNTREGKVLEKILKKLDVMRDQMGEDRVYDVVDELYEGVPLIKLIERSIDQEDVSAVERETEAYIQRISEGKARSLVELHSNRSLSSRLELQSAKELRDISDENRLQPCFIQRFFTTAYRSAGGTITRSGGALSPPAPVFHVGPTPNAIMDVARQIGLPLAEKYETPFVFDKDLVSVASPVRVPENTKLLAPGHPLFVAVIEWAIQRTQDAFAKGATLVDPNDSKSYKFWLIRSTIEDGRHESKKRPRLRRDVPLAHEQLRLVVGDGTELRVVSPAYLLNCTVLDSSSELPALPSSNTDEIQLWAYEQVTEPQLGKVQDSRQKECELRREYLNTTFTDLILELQDKLNDLFQAQLFGEDNTEECEALDERLRTLKERKQVRLKELEQMVKLSANLPEIITSAVVLPPPVAVAEFARIQEPESDEVSQGIPMRRDDEVERIAMEEAMRYEQSRGWMPYDISMDGEHYDIRSESPTGEKRFIEVKGRAGTGAIVLTAPETDKLRQLGDRAFLYIVTFCKCAKPSRRSHPENRGRESGTDRPRLRIIRNPISHLTLEPLYRQIQYFVRESIWAEHGEEVQTF